MILRCLHVSACFFVVLVSCNLVGGRIAVPQCILVNGSTFVKSFLICGNGRNAFVDRCRKLLYDAWCMGGLNVYLCIVDRH